MSEGVAGRLTNTFNWAMFVLPWALVRALG